MSNGVQHFKTLKNICLTQVRVTTSGEVMLPKPTVLSKLRITVTGITESDSGESSGSEESSEGSADMTFTIAVYGCFLPTGINFFMWVNVVSAIHVVL